jgi:glycine betaine/proline transport system permease protein
VSASIKVELSLRAIMAGVNQIIMLQLSMDVIAALAGGLGEPVVTGLDRPDVTASFVGGIGIVIIAIMLDRVTRGLEKGRDTAKKTA